MFIVLALSNMGA